MASLHNSGAGLPCIWNVRFCQTLLRMNPHEASTEQRRAENSRAMKSPASLLLGVVCFVLMFCATVFYNRPITDNPVVFSYLRGLKTPTVQ